MLQSALLLGWPYINSSLLVDYQQFPVPDTVQAPLATSNKSKYKYYLEHGAESVSTEHCMPFCGIIRHQITLKDCCSRSSHTHTPQQLQKLQPSFLFLDLHHNPISLKVKHVHKSMTNWSSSAVILLASIHRAICICWGRGMKNKFTSVKIKAWICNKQLVAAAASQ